VVLPLLSSVITVTRLASASKAGKGGTTLDRSRTIEREVPLQGMHSSRGLPHMHMHTSTTRP
jgi:hypothetical protein